MRRALGLVGVLTTLGCSSTAEPRAQALVVLDTTAPLVGQLVDHPEFSGDVAVDTVRVDVIDDAGNAYDFRDVVAPDPADWPISFGIEPGVRGVGSHARLRIRLFRGALASPGELAGVATLDPPSQVTIDRLVDIPIPDEGIAIRRVVLEGGCLGSRPSFLAPRSTCIDAEHRGDPALSSQAVSRDVLRQRTRAGTWADAVEVPCRGAAPAGASCVPGGVSVLGDLTITGIGASNLPSLPLHPVRLPPRFVDDDEFTVGRLRALVNAGAVTATPQVRVATDALWKYCTWLGASDASNDALPANCVDFTLATAACHAVGGEVWTEAEFEHAARGRGQGRRYPWGAEEPDCCITSVSRHSSATVPVLCPGEGVEPVGSHPPSPSCTDGVGDVSRDGLRDLGGSLSEMTRDVYASYGSECWQGAAVPFDPLCVDPDVVLRSMRGGEWSGGLTLANPAIRKSNGTGFGPTVGFRCVYEDAP